MSGRKNGIARHPSPCYIGRVSAGHCSKHVNNLAGDRTVSCYLLGYWPYPFRCPADLRTVVAATSAENNSHCETDSVRYGHRPVFGRSPEDVRTDSVHVTELCSRWGELGSTKKKRALPMPDIGRAMWMGHKTHNLIALCAKCHITLANFG